jgi:hypothetical protein
MRRKFLVTAALAMMAGLLVAPGAHADDGTNPAASPTASPGSGSDSGQSDSSAPGVPDASVDGSVAGVEPPTPSTNPPDVGDLPPPGQVITYGIWGVGPRGKFSYVGTDLPTLQAEAATNQPTGTCTEYIRNIWLNGHSTFENETSQTCSGYYGYQWIKYQIWRSSWSGWRGYTSWGTSGSTYSNYLDLYWSAPCHWGGGTYDYIGVMEGHSSVLGTGPRVRTDNKVRYPCGATA